MYRKWHEKLNYYLLILPVILSLSGLVFIYSSSFRDRGFADVQRQLLFFFLGLLLMALTIAIDYQILARLYKYIYVFTVLLLVIVLILGETIRGAQRWMSLGLLGSFQPSEIAKLLIIIILASSLSQSKNLASIKSLFISLMYVGIPMVLILIQPDLGTSLVLAVTSLFMLFFAGVNPFFLVIMVVCGIGVMSRFLKEYQIKRLLVFIDPYSDPKGGGWNIIQSLIAVGSGGLLGKGLFAGTQTQLKFVPERSTDFIFTVIAEELGFIGCLFILLLYFFLMWQGIKVAFLAQDLLGKLLAVGVVTMIFFHVLVNIGMTIGIMPITGIPLPFLSYGGSSLITNMMSVGLLINIHLRKDRILP